MLPSFFLHTDAEGNGEKKFIKWVDFSVSYEALRDTLETDIKSHEEGNTPYNWIELLAFLASRYGGDFGRYKKSDLTRLLQTAEEEQESIDALGRSMQNYAYFKEAYDAVLGGFVGEFSLAGPKGEGGAPITKKYGLKAFSPIAKGYSYSHFDDFGNARSYGFKRKHLGHDLMGSVGTPVVAVESGIVEAVGWNQYGGWRIGIRSFDKKRYHYYAHLRKDHPYNDMYEGKVVTAGEVIGYLGMTGYSTKENVNNINTPHLHYGMQLIFDEATQKEGNNEIWIDLYALTKLLEKNRSAVTYDKESKEYYRTYEMFETNTEE
ncbi:MAG: M23 family metallopeptidase [Ruminococcaceae bacterium]|nr:M23 family metallopeptidase [Oscillospiraceae bacterium]